MPLSPLARAALEYADRFGWSVFPLLPRSKIPNGRLVASGHLCATTDIEQISAWWTAAPDSNIGLRPTDWFAVDVDPRNQGDETLGELQRAHGWLPHTVRAVTGGGGEHILFRVPAGVSQLTGKLGQGIEIKSSSGYIVAAPSAHDVTGRSYLWDAGAHPADTEIADPPDWLLRLVTPAAAFTDKPTGPAAQTFLAVAFQTMGWLGPQLRNGAIAVRCPNFATHSDGRGNGSDSSTVILPPTTDANLGAFRCAHAHCVDLDTMRALVMLDVKAIEAAAAEHPRAFAQAVHRLRRGPLKRPKT